MYRWAQNSPFFSYLLLSSSSFTFFGFENYLTWRDFDLRIYIVNTCSWYLLLSMESPGELAHKASSKINSWGCGVGGGSIKGNGSGVIFSIRGWCRSSCSSLFWGSRSSFCVFFHWFFGVDFDICLVPSPMIDFDSNDYAGWNRQQQQKNYFFNFTVDVMHYEYHILV